MQHLPIFSSADLTLSISSPVLKFGVIVVKYAAITDLRINSL